MIIECPECSGHSQVGFDCCQCVAGKESLMHIWNNREKEMKCLYLILVPFLLTACSENRNMNHVNNYNRQVALYISCKEIKEKRKFSFANDVLFYCLNLTHGYEGKK